MGDITMDRKKFMRELAFLLQDISEEEKDEALAFYEDYFDEAGRENEQKVIEELGTPERVAAIIKDGLKGRFDDHIEAGNSGFSNQNYSQNYEVIDVDVKETKKEKKTTSSQRKKGKWDEMNPRDRNVLILLAIVACVPFSFSMIKAIFGGTLGLFGGLYGAGFSVFSIFLCFIFGFWIITIACHIAAFVLIVLGVLHLFALPGAGLIYMGIGCILIALGSIFGKIAVWFFRDCIPSIFNAIADGIGKIFHPRGA